MTFVFEAFDDGKNSNEFVFEAFDEPWKGSDDPNEPAM